MGAGSAGAIVLNRLPSDARDRVPLLEHGPTSHPWSRIPIGYTKLLTNPVVNWCYTCEPEANMNTTCDCRALLLGIEQRHKHGQWKNNRVENSHQPT
jgi:choline dehydrogenase-like flavoprotein